MEPEGYRFCDKSSWPRGEWDNEPDRLEWRHQGFPCLIVRGEMTGALCGYVGVPPDHPCFGGVPDEVDLHCHGGVIWQAFSNKDLTEGWHYFEPRDGEPPTVFWIGFDCAHAWDQIPMLMLPRLRLLKDWTYRNLEYVKIEVEGLADQLAVIKLPEWSDLEIEPAL